MIFTRLRHKSNYFFLKKNCSIFLLIEILASISKVVRIHTELLLGTSSFIAWASLEQTTLMKIVTLVTLDQLPKMFFKNGKKQGLNHLHLNCVTYSLRKVYLFLLHLSSRSLPHFYSFILVSPLPGFCFLLIFFTACMTSELWNSYFTSSIFNMKNACKIAE